MDWIVFVLLQLICILFTFIGIIILKKDYRRKIKSGYEFVKGDFEPTR